MTSALKLKEAAFFIELLTALEGRGESLTHADDAALEASFLFAAILNSFYSTVEMLRAKGACVGSFRKKYPEIYAQGDKGGERAMTVHIDHKLASRSGYIPPRGGDISLTFRRDPKFFKEAARGKNDLVFSPMHYMYITLKGEEVHALEFFEEHLQKLSMARDFDRQVAELQVRAAILNRFTRLGTPTTVAMA